MSYAVLLNFSLIIVKILISHKTRNLKAEVAPKSQKHFVTCFTIIHNIQVSLIRYLRYSDRFSFSNSSCYMSKSLLAYHGQLHARPLWHKFLI